MGIGEEAPASLKRVQQTFPMPKTRPEVVQAVGAILALGRVQKLTVELGKPIKAVRLLSEEEIAKTPGVTEGDLYDDVVNGELAELASDTLNPRERIAAAFDLITNKGLQPVHILAIDPLNVRRALGMVDTPPYLFGVPILAIPDLPEEIVLIAAAHKEDPEGVVYTLKVDILTPAVVAPKTSILDQMDQAVMDSHTARLKKKGKTK